MSNLTGKPDVPDPSGHFVMQFIYHGRQLRALELTPNRTWNEQQRLNMLQRELRQAAPTFYEAVLQLREKALRFMIYHEMASMPKLSRNHELQHIYSRAMERLRETAA